MLGQESYHGDSTWGRQGREEEDAGPLHGWEGHQERRRKKDREDTGTPPVLGPDATPPWHRPAAPMLLKQALQGTSPQAARWFACLTSLGKEEQSRVMITSRQDDPNVSVQG